MIRQLLLASVLTCSASAVRAQVVFEGKEGPVEVIGLQRWTLRDLEDSIARYRPGESLRSHACAAILQHDLHFPSAAATTFMQADGSAPPYVVVVVVEPQDSAKATRRKVSGPAAPALWPELRALARSGERFDARDLMSALNLLSTVRRLGADSALKALEPYFGREPLEQAVTLGTVLDSLSGPDQLALALRTLASDANAENRQLAALVLTPHAARNEAWYAAVGGMRDDDENVSSMARTALKYMAAAAARPIDWTPAAEDLRALLGGARVWDYASVLDVLVRTGLHASLAAPLLADNGHLVLAHARAAHKPSAEPARKLLRQLSGLEEPAAWEKWLGSLPAARVPQLHD